MNDNKKKNSISDSAASSAGRLASKGISKAVASKVGAAMGTAFGPVGTAVGHAAGTIIGNIAGDAAVLAKRGIRKAASLTAALPAAAVAGTSLLIASLVGAAAAAGIAVIGSLIAVPLAVAFMLTIINNSAYMVPPTTSNISGGPFGGGINVGATCPIPGGVIFIGSYGTNLTRFGHGENEYWDSVAGSCGDYPLSGCYARQPGDYCYNSGNSCSTYGQAIDVRYPSGGSAGRSAFLPFIKGQEATWVLASVNTNCNCAGTLRAVVDGDVYEMYISHLTRPPLGGVSGDPVGIMDASAHVHIEMRINGEWANPESMCDGSSDGQFGSGDTTGTDSRSSCSAAGGECLDVPSCGRAGRSAVNGTCFNSTSVCCTLEQAPVENAACETRGGTCYTPETLQILNPGVGNIDSCEAGLLQTVAGGTCSANQFCCRSAQ